MAASSRSAEMRKAAACKTTLSAMTNPLPNDEVLPNLLLPRGICHGCSDTDVAHAVLGCRITRLCGSKS